MIPAQSVNGGNEHLQRCITGSGAHTRQRRVDAVGAVFDRDDRIGDTQRQVVMRVDTDFRCRQECLTQGVDPLGDISHGHRTTGVDDVDTTGAVAFHLLRLPANTSGVAI